MRTEQGHDFNVKLDPLSYTAGIEVLNGTTAQTYNTGTKEYEPSRALDPLILQPWISLLDPLGEHTGKANVISSLWYLGSPQKGVQILSSMDGYEVDGIKLKITKDFPINEGTEITCVLFYNDPRTNESMRCEQSILLRTAYYEGHAYKVELNHPNAWHLDPSRWQRNENDIPVIELDAQLYDGTKRLIDTTESVDSGVATKTNVAYIWMYLDNGNYVKMTNDCPWLMTRADAKGNLPGTIQINADNFDELAVKVYALEYDDSVPTQPRDADAFATTFVKRQLPQTAYAKSVVDLGKYIKPGEHSTIQMHVEIYDNAILVGNNSNASLTIQEICDLIDKYYHVEWWYKSHAAGSVEKHLKDGALLVTTTDEVGMTQTNGVQIFPKVYEKGAFVPVVNSAGRVLVDASGNIVVSQTIKK